MTTLIIHGTFADSSGWCSTSWQGNGFLAGLQQGMISANGQHDIWSINGNRVTDYSDLGFFDWGGSFQGSGRGQGAIDFARYLNEIAKLTDEPIRIIAHSHGCNVVKLATSLKELSPQVYIEQAVFLACPHFYEDNYVQDELSWMDRVNIAKVSKAYHKSGYFFRYPLNPDRLGRVLNVYCEKDTVQCDHSQTFGGTMVPLTGSFMENVKSQMMHGTVETPHSSRWEMDDRAAHLYENIELEISGDCNGLKAHSAVHGSKAGQLCGVWLNTGLHIGEIIQQAGKPVLSCSDDGS